MKDREPASVTAQPMSTDEEGEGGPEPLSSLKYHSVSSDDDDDDDDGNRRTADIQPTTFSKTQPGLSHLGNVRRSAREKLKPRSRSKTSPDNSQPDEPSSSAGSKRYIEEFAVGMGDHLNKKMNAKRRSSHLQKTYGSKSSQSSSQQTSSQQRSSQSSAPRSSALQPIAAKVSPKKAFVTYDSIEESSPKKQGFKHVSTDSSPSQNRQGPKFMTNDGVSDDSPRKAMKTYRQDDSTKSRAVRATKPHIRVPRGGKHAKSQTDTRTKPRQNSPIPVAEEQSQRAIFKMPDSDGLGPIMGSDNDIVLLDTRPAVKVEDDLDLEESQPHATARCPMCHEEVDPELLAKHSDRGRMNIKKQTAFCRLHKRDSALSSGSEKGYPKIDWETLDKRCDKHEKFLKEVLEGTRPSHYRNILKERVQSGKNRTILKTDDSLTPGYYGPRGLRAMTEYIMRTLSSVVRKRAIEDRLVSARGYTGYVQTVLVPELAIRLIMEDMRVTEEAARAIMDASVEIGELLHEDAGDVVANLTDDEDELG